MLKQSPMRFAMYVLIPLFLLAYLLPTCYQLTLPDQKSVFTWISHTVSKSDAEWCLSLGFTDVVVRYDGDETETYANLATYGLRYWKYQSPAFTDPLGLYSVTFFETELGNALNWSLSHCVYVDDCHYIASAHGQQAFCNFLDAARKFGDSIILVFPLSSLLAECNFEGLNIDVYYSPSENTDALASLNAESVGGYLWAWRQTWNTLNASVIYRVYAEAILLSCARFTVWMGHETDEFEQGMCFASLYNYPGWWQTIINFNSRFLGKFTVQSNTVTIQPRE